MGKPMPRTARTWLKHADTMREISEHLHSAYALLSQMPRDVVHGSWVHSLADLVEYAIRRRDTLNDMANGKDYGA